MNELKFFHFLNSLRTSSLDPALIFGANQNISQEFNQKILDAWYENGPNFPLRTLTKLEDSSRIQPVD